jgi:hypothetical protein
MHVALRRLIIVGAISLFGTTAGVTLGNFVAGGPKLTGAEELVNYTSMLGFDGNDSQADTVSDPDFARQAGPGAYECQGCDARLHNDIIPADTASADLAPLPAYHVEDAPLPPRRDVVPPAMPSASVPEVAPLVKTPSLPGQ